ncbi:phytanoyl-CoA dioxygenase family protein [Bosea sp. TAF32]|uniref:phytanoyl-CoA dioxygenase family protein n=1 Tax=Bosea sp. TAF32 TaxID=3237482 RepID=UPI003F931E7E
MTAITERSYGIHRRVAAENDLDDACETLATLGYGVLNGGYTSAELDELSAAFDAARLHSEEAAGGREILRELDEHNTIRVAFHHDRNLLALATNQRVLTVVRRAISDYLVLSQQNGIINPANAAEYNQGAWHRDLPYQHVVFSRPMAINALFCVDDFTLENGATIVLPATHRQEDFPSSRFVQSAALQITAPRGSYILLDCMTYHTGATNRTPMDRRAVNHVYTSPIIRQQIDLPALLGESFTDDPHVRKLLGYGVKTPRSLDEYYASRRR